MRTCQQSPATPGLHVESCTMCCAQAQTARQQTEPSCMRRRSEGASAPQPCQHSRSTDPSRHHPCKDDHRDHAGCWLQVIRKGRYSIANCVSASFERSCTSILFCKTILQTTAMPTPTLFSRNGRLKQTKISSKVSQSIAGDLLVTIRVLLSPAQLCWG